MIKYRLHCLKRNCEGLSLSTLHLLYGLMVVVFAVALIKVVWEGVLKWQAIKIWNWVLKYWFGF